MALLRAGRPECQPGASGGRGSVRARMPRYVGVDEQLQDPARRARRRSSPRPTLRRKLASGRPLRVKLGIDPTASDIHLGFAVVLRKLRQFQELGHTAVLIIGDFTAQVGDPSGKSATRPRLTKEEVDAYAATYVEQAAPDPPPEPPRGPPQLRVARARWTSKTCCASRRARPSPACSSATTSPRATATASPISVMEFLYPLLQGWDSVMVQADVELGGTDQLFNNLDGPPAPGAGGPGAPGRAHHAAARRARRRQEDVEVAGQLRRHRRAAGRAVRQAHVAARRAHAPLLHPHHRLAPRPDRRGRRRRWRRVRSRPVDAKRLLARTVVDLYHGDGARAAAEAEFDRVFRVARGADRHPRVRGRRRRAARRAGAAGAAAGTGVPDRGAVEQGGRPQDHPGRRPSRRRRRRRPRSRAHPRRPRRARAPARPPQLGPSRKSDRLARRGPRTTLRAGVPCSTVDEVVPARGDKMGNRRWRVARARAARIVVVSRRWPRPSCPAAPQVRAPRCCRAPMAPAHR